MECLAAISTETLHGRTAKIVWVGRECTCGVFLVAEGCHAVHACMPASNCDLVVPCWQVVALKARLFAVELHLWSYYDCTTSWWPAGGGIRTVVPGNRKPDSAPLASSRSVTVLKKRYKTRQANTARKDSAGRVGAQAGAATVTVASARLLCRRRAWCCACMLQARVTVNSCSFPGRRWPWRHICALWSIKDHALTAKPGGGNTNCGNRTQPPWPDDAC